MKKKTLIGVSICAVVLLILASLTNVVGYQTLQVSNKEIINDVFDLKELVFQTMVDIANNKEIQGIILRYQLSQGKLPDTPIPVLTMKQLKQMYVVGLIISKTMSKAKMHSMMEKYQVNNPAMQKEINAVIEKDVTLNREMKQVSELGCSCENDNKIEWKYPVICLILWILGVVLVFFWTILEYVGFGVLFRDLFLVLHEVGIKYDCW